MMPSIATRPTSSPQSTLVRVKSTPSIKSSDSEPSRGHVPARTGAPYMVALAGWPEPVYIANPTFRSRPSTPTSSRDVRDGIRTSVPSTPKRAALAKRDKDKQEQEQEQDIPGVLEQSIFSRTCMYSSHPDEPCPIPDHPNHVVRYANSPSASSIRTRPSSPERDDYTSAFPTSSARGTPHPSPPSSSRTSPLLSQAPTIPPPTQDPRRHGPFKDPRFAPHVAVMHNRPALPLTPNWSISSATPATTGVGVKVTAGQRGSGFLIMRAVPDVYPPPAPAPGMAGMATGMAKAASGKGNTGGRVGVATEVYPRDPNSAFLWGTAAVSSRSGSVSLVESGNEGMEVDDHK